MQEDFNEGLALGGPIVCKRWSVVHRALQHCTAINAVPPPLLPFQECPPIDRGCVVRRNVLGGGFVVVVNFETHIANERNIFCPILGVEDEVRNVFSPFVDIDSGGGGRFGRWSRVLPKLIGRPLLFNLDPSLRSMEEAGNSAAPKKMETNLLPPRVVTSRLTAMRSSMRRPGSGLTRAAATSFDGRMNFARQEQRAPSPRQSVPVGAMIE